MNQNDDCNYLDANTQNASDMNLNCVNNPLKGNDKYCQSEYKLYDNIAREHQYLQIKRDTDAGYSVLKNSSQIIQKNNNYGIEGFTGKIFVTDNGPGKSNITGKCPEGYRWDKQNNICIQVCTNCKYNEEQEKKSKIFNEADPCFPEGTYAGINNSGKIECTCGENNKYCSDNFVNNVFQVIGLL
tara:strand:- start:44 stop:598 length:555 start_codon:yes stop_codon:yes gene_type:complete